MNLMETAVKEYYKLISTFVPYDEHFMHTFQIAQNLDEMEQVCEYLKDRNFNNFIEVGSHMGGSLWIYTFTICSPTVEITCVEPYKHRTLLYVLAELKKRARIVTYCNDYSYNVANEIPNNIDLLHIDGLHDYEEVKRDWDLYSGKVKDNGGVILLHDTDSDHAGTVKLRKELEGRKEYKMRTFTANNKLGITVIEK